jgi:tRNA(fMet)-specific endonuclease VapC
LYLPSIVLGELYTGINRVINKAKHLKKLTDFLQLCTVVTIDALTSKHYGEIIAALFKKGKPIPTNDVWIASLAKQHSFTLVTTDKHFNEIPDFQFKKW